MLVHDFGLVHLQQSGFRQERPEMTSQRHQRQPGRCAQTKSLALKSKSRKHRKFPCQALSPYSLHSYSTASFPSDHHTVLYWLVDCTVIWVSFHHSNVCSLNERNLPPSIAAIISCRQRFCMELTDWSFCSFAENFFFLMRNWNKMKQGCMQSISLCSFAEKTTKNTRNWNKVKQGLHRINQSLLICREGERER